ncbi:mucin-12-like isoform X2 [Eriocheir sinensis]|uniref:mucin-12-like isoform X2 n=1 Tax=Eriocheir sinensis TaxID=95602 RepID=UPI0021C7D0CC|nr:mucin-12-like isoform X2 [Eriocheir sinensis]
METDRSMGSTETWETRAAELFTVCDRECKGFITKRDLQHLWGELPLDPDELEAVFDSLDKDHNGFLSLQEFTNGFGSHLGLVIEFQADSSSSSSEGEQLLEAGDEGGVEGGGVEGQLDGILSILASQDLDSNSAVVEAVWREIGGAGVSMERLVAALLQELSRVRLEHGHLEAALATKTDQFNQQVSRLYEELEAQISGEQAKAAKELRQKGARALATLEEEVAERDAALRALEEEQQSLRQRLEQAAAAEVAARQDNLRLEQHLTRLEEDLLRREAEVEELMQALDIHRRNTKNEKRRRAQHAFKVTEGIARERESLVTQLDLLRTINTQLRDEQDQTVPWSLRARERADLGGVGGGGGEDDYRSLSPPPHSTDLRSHTTSPPPPRPSSLLHLPLICSPRTGSGGTGSDCEHDDDYFSGAGVGVEGDSPVAASPGEVSLLHEILSQPPLCVECGGALPRRPSEHSVAMGTSTLRPSLLRRQESFTQTSPTAETSPRSIDTLVNDPVPNGDAETNKRRHSEGDAAALPHLKKCICSWRVKITSSPAPTRWFSSSLVVFQPRHTHTPNPHLQGLTTHQQGHKHTSTHLQIVHQTLHTHLTRHTFHTSFTYFHPDVSGTITRHTKATQHSATQQHSETPKTTQQATQIAPQHQTTPKSNTALPELSHTKSTEHSTTQQHPGTLKTTPQATQTALKTTPNTQTTLAPNTVLPEQRSNSSQHSETLKPAPQATQTHLKTTPQDQATLSPNTVLPEQRSNSLQHSETLKPAPQATQTQLKTTPQDQATPAPNTVLPEQHAKRPLPKPTRRRSKETQIKATQEKWPPKQHTETTTQQHTEATQHQTDPKRQQRQQHKTMTSEQQTATPTIQSQQQHTTPRRRIEQNIFMAQQRFAEATQQHKHEVTQKQRLESTPSQQHKQTATLQQEESTGTQQHKLRTTQATATQKQEKESTTALQQLKQTATQDTTTQKQQPELSTESQQLKQTTQATATQKEEESTPSQQGQQIATQITATLQQQEELTVATQQLKQTTKLTATPKEQEEPTPSPQHNHTATLTQHPESPTAPQQLNQTTQKPKATQQFYIRPFKKQHNASFRTATPYQPPTTQPQQHTATQETATQPKEQHSSQDQRNTQPQSKTEQHSDLEHYLDAEEQHNTKQHSDIEHSDTEQYTDAVEQQHQQHSKTSSSSKQHSDQEGHSNTQDKHSNTNEDTTEPLTTETQTQGESQQHPSEKQEHTDDQQHTTATQKEQQEEEEKEEKENNTTQDSSDTEADQQNNTKQQHQQGSNTSATHEQQELDEPQTHTHTDTHTDKPGAGSDQGETGQKDTQDTPPQDSPRRKTTPPLSSSSSSRQERDTYPDAQVTLITETRPRPRRSTPTQIVTPLRHQHPLIAAQEERQGAGVPEEEPREERAKEEAAGRIGQTEGATALSLLPRSRPAPDADSLLYCPTRLFKVVFIGDSGVGKTTFIHRASTGEYRCDFGSTVGVDYRTVEVRAVGVVAVLQLWDTAGQERFRSITRQYYRNADCVVVMYDLTSEHSFLNVVDWISSVREAGSEGVMVAVVGNKEDMRDQRRVDLSAANRLAKSHGCFVCECSAAVGSSVQEVLTDLTSLLLSGQSLQMPVRTPALSLSHPRAAAKTCCKS